MFKYETNSRLIKPGQTFVAIKGYTVDGHDYIEDAIKNGATAVIAQKEVKCDVPVTVVENSAEYYQKLLVKEYKDEFKDLKLIGITGTNGKTTSAYLTYQMLLDLGKKAAYIGTIGFMCGDYFKELPNTSPEILTTYKLLEKAKEMECEYVVMEVSNFALDQKRIEGLEFVAGAFTNLTEDHLDYHKTMENYLKAKLLITDYIKNDGVLLVNKDDEASKKFIERFKNTKTFGYGNADYDILSDDIYPDHTDIIFKVNEKGYKVTTNLTSKFNVYNYFTMFSILHELGFEINELIEKTKDLKAPKGRCETYKVKDGFAVVDYAHTPDAVLKTVTAYKELAKARVITLVGCGGDRDPMKRPIMGEIASNYSDYVIFTNDNPRTEDPENIMKDILKGVKKDNYEVCLDRREAIKKALDMIQKDDIVLLLGKGHEDYQILGHTKVHLDDSEEILKYIEKSE
ncbi:uDP-N-acetylmuramoyl-L-alanyl-D-glutamate--2 6-diaminopimelate ligase 2 [Firmicutes bacterium CAG:822]|nr:uDP-N-acetylmuramoyl-L-alanyl-D-glutamate--2 6-diaminopimelate ligase 2 [Firmicutes bacterium CAG:822]